MNEYQPPLRLVLVEDHSLVLESLAVAFGGVSGFEVVGAVTGAEEFERLLADPGVRPDVVVTDADLGGTPAHGVIERTIETTDAEVLVITGLQHERALRLALETGAAGFVAKTARLAELVNAVRTVAEGGAVFPAEHLRRTLAPQPPDGEGLTDREQQMLEQLADGQTVAEIAAALHLSPHTIRNHVRSLRTKLGARSQLEVVVKAVRSGLVEIH